MGNRIKKEKDVVGIMIKLYCNKKHKTKKDLCPKCEELLKYTHIRLDNCKFGEKKSSCFKCPIHCYRNDMRERIKEVMKFSGPRIIIYKPYEFLRHLVK